MKGFCHLLGNSLLANTTNFIVWATIVYWAYLSTNSVLATSIISGIYLVTVAFSGFVFGSIVDHHRKKTAMIISSIATLLFFALALVAFQLSPEGAFTTIKSFHLWAVTILLLAGVIVGNIRMIALPTAVTILVPEERRGQANGMSGTVFGISFALSNIGAGFGFGFFGLSGILIFALVATVISIIHLLFVHIEEEKIISTEGEGMLKKIDIKGTVSVVKGIPGLFPLIFFTTFNNFLGGVFMALMDAYGLSLVSVKVWGTLWGVLSLGFIVGGLYISKKGVGKNPVKTLLNVNIVTWSLCIIMTLQPSIVLLGICMFVYLCVMPFIESSEQTVIQKVVSAERQGRVFGFAQSVEQMASPITAFVIGPIAQFFFIPFMTTGKGVELIGSWYGTGIGRGIGLVFICAGIIGLTVTLIARRSKVTKLLSENYAKENTGEQSVSN